MSHDTAFMVDVIRRSRNSVRLDSEAHQHLASSPRLGPATRQIHEAEAQKLHDILLSIDEILEGHPA